jgi:hypothetical protein
MCIIHKGFRGFQAVSPASNLVGNLIGLKPVIPYEIIHLTLEFIQLKLTKVTPSRNWDSHPFRNEFQCPAKPN